VFLAREDPSTDPFPAQKKSSQAPEKLLTHFWAFPFNMVLCSEKILPFGCLSGTLGVDKCSISSARRGIMKFLLTSAGIKNDSIRSALVDLLGKPIAESSALCIPTGAYAMGGPGAAWQLITGRASTPLSEVGWKSLGVLELTALPSLTREQWVPMLQEADALLVCGGDVLYLCYWMRQSGLADLLPQLSRETVYVGVSSGSMVVTPNFGEAYDGDFCREPPASHLPKGDERALGLVDFSVFPHLDYPSFPENSLANAERWAAKRPVPTYAIDDQTAIVVRDGEVEVVSEGHWKRFTP
jgi:dipeptidase E